MSGSGDATAYQPPKIPEVRALAADDIVAALTAGLADFRAAPVFGLFFGAVYAAGGLAILAFLTVIDVPWMIFPFAIGFPLIGPFVAAGLYDISRRLAVGDPLHWRGILLLMIRQRERQLSWMAFVVLFIFWIWIYQVRLLLALFLGFISVATIGEFVTIVTATEDGLLFLAVGTCVGAILALILFTSTVVSIPLLLDRELDFVTAIITSFRAVSASPVVMLGWGLIVTASAIAAMLPAFLGLLVVLPVLGHTTWHLYTKAVAAGE